MFKQSVVESKNKGVYCHYTFWITSKPNNDWVNIKFQDTIENLDENNYNNNIVYSWEHKIKSLYWVTYILSDILYPPIFIMITIVLDKDFL